MSGELVAEAFDGTSWQPIERVVEARWSQGGEQIIGLTDAGEADLVIDGSPPSLSAGTPLRLQLDDGTQLRQVWRGWVAEPATADRLEQLAKLRAVDAVARLASFGETRPAVQQALLDTAPVGLWSSLQTVDDRAVNLASFIQPLGWGPSLWQATLISTSQGPPAVVGQSASLSGVWALPAVATSQLPITIGLWLRLESTTARIVAHFAQTGVRVFDVRPGRITIEWPGLGSTDGTRLLSLGRPTFVALTVDASQATLWVNGKEDTRLTTGAPVAPSTFLVLRAVDATADWAVVWHRVVTSSELAAITDAGRRGYGGAATDVLAALADEVGVGWGGPTGVGTQLPDPRPGDAADLVGRIAAAEGRLVVADHPNDGRLTIVPLDIWDEGLPLWTLGDTSTADVHAAQLEATTRPEPRLSSASSTSGSSAVVPMSGEAGELTLDTMAQASGQLLSLAAWHAHIWPRRVWRATVDAGAVDVSLISQTPLGSTVRVVSTRLGVDALAMLTGIEASHAGARRLQVDLTLAELPALDEPLARWDSEPTGRLAP